MNMEVRGLQGSLLEINRFMINQCEQSLRHIVKDDLHTNRRPLSLYRVAQTWRLCRCGICQQ